MRRTVGTQSQRDAGDCSRVAVIAGFGAADSRALADTPSAGVSDVPRRVELDRDNRMS